MCGYVGSDSTIVLPSNYKGADYAIGEILFLKNTAVSDVTIPVGVTSIGFGAFAACTGLTSIKIPNSVTSIGDFAFCGCTRLTNIEIPNNVKHIGAYAFENCVNLDKITIGDNVEFIGESAFLSTAWYKNQQNVGLVYLNNWLLGYSGTEPLKKINIKEATIGIASGAFKNEELLKSVKINIEMKYICNNAFADCRSLKKVKYPKNKENIKIHSDAFKGCWNL